LTELLVGGMFTPLVIHTTRRRVISGSDFRHRRVRFICHRNLNRSFFLVYYKKLTLLLSIVPKKALSQRFRPLPIMIVDGVKGFVFY